MKHTFEADGIQLAFGQRQLLTDIYFKCETGKITGLLGRNGEGKTCLMNIVYGSRSLPDKSVRFDNVFVKEAFRHPNLLTYLPQFSFIPGFLSLKRVLLDFALSYADFAAYFPEFTGMEEEKIQHLSGGQRRLIEVYVIIKAKSQFAMLDEPFSHIMPLHTDRIKAILLEEKVNKGFLITDHLYQQIIDICDSLYLLVDGKLHLTKTLEDLERLGYVKSL